MSKSIDDDFVEITRNLGEIDRIVHEPARLMIITLLSSVESADFLNL